MTCPYCPRHWSPGVRPEKVGVRKRRLLDHLRTCHGPLRIADVRALHALSAAAFRTWTTPIDTPGVTLLPASNPE
jgi:hypothetical protein